MASSSTPPFNTNTDRWTKNTNNECSTDVQETTLSTEDFPLAPVRRSYFLNTSSSMTRPRNNNARLNSIHPAIPIHEHSPECSSVTRVQQPSNWLSPEENSRTVDNVQHIAIIGIISAFLLAIIIIGVITLIFSLQQDVPTGTILLYGGYASALRGHDDRWLFCNGSEVSRVTYQSLFSVIDTTYGVGNGIDTFNLPDFRARFPLGSVASSDTSLITGGQASHTITIAELPAHNHDQGSLQSLNSGVHTHSYIDPGHNHGGSTGTGPLGVGTFAMVNSGGYGNDGGTHTHTIDIGRIGITIQSDGSHTHTISGSTGTEGQGQPIDITPPYQTVHYIIRT